ncbi:hypothetical protein AB837_00036 [bacterium AB1]|nr:hypothetical protein AB837_00036 [bacterium AB1]
MKIFIYSRTSNDEESVEQIQKELFKLLDQKQRLQQISYFVCNVTNNYQSKKLYELKSININFLSKIVKNSILVCKSFKHLGVTNGQNRNILTILRNNGGKLLLLDNKDKEKYLDFKSVIINY